MHKLIAIAMILALSTCLLAGCRNRNTDTTIPSTTVSTQPSTHPSTTAPSATPMPTVTTPGTTGEGVLPSIADELMPDSTDGSNGEISRSRPRPRY